MPKYRKTLLLKNGGKFIKVEIQFIVLIFVIFSIFCKYLMFF